MSPGSNSVPIELSQLRVRLRLLKSMASCINSGLEPTRLGERMLLEVHKHMPGFCISYCALDSQGLICEVASVAPLHMPGRDGRRFNVKQSEALAMVLRTGEKLIVTDVDDDPRMGSFREVSKEVQARALLYVSIRHPLGAPAFIGLASATPHQWSAHEVDMLEDMAEYLAIAIRENHLQAEREQMQQQLVESQKMEAVGRLVGGVAHDFNNLLTGMMIYSGLLATALGPENPLQRHVREIQTAGERGASLVGQLLSLSRHHVLELRLLSLNDVLTQMREMLQRVLGEEVLLECHFAGDLAHSRIDENQVSQALLNLAINAKDAMKQGGNLLLSTSNIRAGEKLAKQVAGMLPGDYVVLTVTDTGSGMSSETRAHCFEPFFTTKATGEGTGLGLAAVYGMMRQHGGSIAVESSPGRGTTFRLYFPVADGDHRPDSALLRPGHERTTILLVEDEDLLRLPLAEKLQAEGYHVISAHAPDSALEAARRFSGRIHLLITDLVMPGMPGNVLAERLASHRPEMLVLYMSGYTNDPRARRLLETGAHFLRKPFTAELFARKIKQLIEVEGLALPEHQAGQQKSISNLGKGT
ncbi:MAG TPA: ATP-binding protein [Terriglobales bacterium]|nr:ATP-binding protein [Terriglobales bacterium]